MGHHIAYREGRHTRLWRKKEIVDLLTKDQEAERTRHMEVISIDLSEAANIKLWSRAFVNMTRLRILCFSRNPFGTSDNCISLPEGLAYLPDGLRYLEWSRYPLPSLPLGFNPENLVELRMEDSKLRQLWTDEVEPFLPSLKHVNLCFSKDLTKLPSFRNSLKLEMLWLWGCENLNDVPDSIQHLVELKSLSFNDNRSLTRFPEFSQLKKLEKLLLAGCYKIRILPQVPPNLITLDLTSTSIKELPPSIQGLSRLESLTLDGCRDLESLPDGICELKNLEKLHFSYCVNLSTLSFLQMPIIEGNPLENLPESIDGLCKLTDLRCPRYMGGSLPCFKRLVSLRELHLQGSGFIESLPEDIKYLTKLWIIDVSNCKGLTCMPELPPGLQYLDASNCISLRTYSHYSSGEFDHQLQSHFYFDRPTLKHENFLRMKFVNCFSLEKDARNEIWRDFWRRAQFVLISYIERRHTHDEWNPDRRRLLSSFCMTRNEVPEWFKYSEIGSCLQINTNSSSGLQPLGFVFCVVLASLPYFDGPETRLIVDCKLRGIFYSRWSSPIIGFGAPHTILWFDCYEYSQFCFDDEAATFQFSAEMHHGNGRRVVLNDAAIVKCGATPISWDFVTEWLPVLKDCNSPQ